MNIVVCIKQVPDTKGGVKFNPIDFPSVWLSTVVADTITSALAPVIIKAAITARFIVLLIS